VRVVPAARFDVLEAELALERERCRRLEAQLRNLADHDPLTDLLNRRSVELEIEAHVARCTRYGPEGALLLVGLSGVDEIAAGLGTEASDEALAALGDRVAGRLRSTDVVGRWGPHELVVLLARVAAAGAAVVAEELVRIVGGTSTPRVPAGSLVAAVGVAVVEVPVDAAPLVARAQRAVDAVRQQETGGWLLATG